MEIISRDRNISNLTGNGSTIADSDTYISRRKCQGIIDSPNRIKMNHLIKSALYKSENGILPPSLNSIKRMNIDNKVEEGSLTKKQSNKIDRNTSNNR